MSDERKAVFHLSVYLVALRATRSILALTDENMEIVAAEGRRSSVAGLGIGLGNSRRYQRSDKALRFALGRFPVQAVVLPFITVNFRGILAMRSQVFFLRRRQFLTNADSRHFIPAHAPVQNFLLPRLGVEIPHAAFIHQRDRSRPILRADI